MNAREEDEHWMITQQKKEIEKWKSLVGELVEALDKAHDGMCRGDETCYVNKVLAKAREAGL